MITSRRRTTTISSSMNEGMGMARGECNEGVEEDGAMDANPVDASIHERRSTIGSWDWVRRPMSMMTS